MSSYKRILDAIDTQDIDTLREIIEYGIPDDIGYIYRYTAQSGHLKVVNYLLSVDPLLEEKELKDMFHAMLIAAVRKGYTSIVNSLITTVQARYIKYSYTLALYKAAKYGHKEIVRILYHNFPSASRFRQIRLAEVLDRLAKHDNLPMIKYIISICTTSGDITEIIYKALIRVVQTNRRSIINYYLELVAISDYTNDDVYKIISRAAERSDIGIFKYILSKVPNPAECITYKNEDIIIDAATMNRVDIMKYCIELIGIKKFKEEYSDPVLYASLQNNCLESAKYIVELIGGIDQESWDPLDALEIAKSFTLETLKYAVDIRLIDIHNRYLTRDLIDNSIWMPYYGKLEYLVQIWARNWPQDSICDVFREFLVASLIYDKPIKHLLRLECLYHQPHDVASVFLRELDSCTQIQLPKENRAIYKMHKELQRAPATVISKPIVCALKGLTRRPAHEIYGYIHYPYIFSDWPAFDEALMTALLE